ncbi:MAG: recombinase family protein [bacterium]|nr:recombinase family protein [bacterium]
MNQPKQVGIWIRVSTEDQATGDSPEHHERRARMYAESKGWDVVEVYHLEAMSGKSVMDYPQTKHMLQDIRGGKITGLIFSKLARLARNTRELLEFAEIFREQNADLISLQESIDTSTPAGRLFYTMIAAMAQWEREEIAERVAASVPIRAKMGKPLGGKAPFGYQWKDSKLIPDPSEAPVRKHINELYLEHKRKRTVARILNEAGYRTRTGTKFSDTTVHRLLRDPVAKGLRRANYTKSMGDGKNWVPKPESEWVLIPVEAIVSEDLWNRCNAILDEQQAKNKRPARRTVHLFSGLVYCACGQKMYVPSNSPKYTCSKCRSKIPLEDLEDLFQHQLKNFFLTSDEVTTYLNRANEAIKEKEDLLHTLQEEQRKVQQEMDRVYRLYIDEAITPKGFGSRYKPLEERLEQIGRQIPEVQAEIDFFRIQYLSSDQILTEARDLSSRWPDLTQAEKRTIVESITEKIAVGADEVAINLCYLPSRSEMVATEQHNLIPALPFCHVQLTATRPLPPAYPRELKTLGDHLRKKRLDLGLLQKDVALHLGVTETSVYSWENGHSSPRLDLLPKVLSFLGYVPGDIHSLDFGDRIVAIRQALGIRQEDLAREMGVDPSTLARWEKGKSKPFSASRRRIMEFFDSFHLSMAGKDLI